MSNKVKIIIGVSVVLTACVLAFALIKTGKIKSPIKVNTNNTKQEKTLDIKSIVAETKNNVAMQKKKVNNWVAESKDKDLNKKLNLLTIDTFFDIIGVLYSDAEAKAGNEKISYLEGHPDTLTRAENFNQAEAILKQYNLLVKTDERKTIARIKSLSDSEKNQIKNDVKILEDCIRKYEKIDSASVADTKKQDNTNNNNVKEDFNKRLVSGLTEFVNQMNYLMTQAGIQ